MLQIGDIFWPKDWEYIGVVVRDMAALSGRGSVFEALRVQLAVAVFLAVVCPFVVITLTIGEKFLATQSLNYAALGGCFAVSLGMILLRRVSAFPGARTFGFILPSYATSFGIVISIFLVMRVDYSSVYFATSFAVSIGAAFVMSFWIERLSSLQFYVIPAGRIELLNKIQGVEWLPLSSPTMPENPNIAIVADLHFDHEDDWERMLAEAAIQGRTIYHTKMLKESLTGRVSINHLSENSFGSLVPNLAYRKVKRFVDVALCVILLPILLIPGLVAAVLIRGDSPGPVFFIQERMGYRGNSFRMVKFRTMHIREASMDISDARADAITQSGDDRITRVGQFLRRSRLDELPQIINILLGEMSWIGPRPEAVELSSWYESEIPFYRYRHIVRPGISGWAQVNQGHVASLDDVHLKLNYDFYYIKNFSAWLDVLIALRTVHTMWTGFGSK